MGRRVKRSLCLKKLVSRFSHEAPGLQPTLFAVNILFGPLQTGPIQFWDGEYRDIVSGEAESVFHVYVFTHSTMIY